MENCVKKKAISIRTELHTTGGGPATQPKLTALEERLIAVLGSACIEGVKNGQDLVGQQGTVVLLEDKHT